MRELMAKAATRSFPNFSFPSVLLSTCNRTEIYFSVEDLADAHCEILSSLREGITESFEPLLYSFFGRDCFSHLATVTTGLDSAVLAETEIQRQVKVAYAQASEIRKLPSAMHFLFQKCLKIGKWMRSSYALFQGLPTLEGTIWHLTQNIFPDAAFNALFVGNSEINRKIISLFRSKGSRQMMLCTRNPHLAEPFALDHGLSLDNWETLERWNEFDLVICATVSDRYLVSGANSKTRLILDLSVPRNVDPNLSRDPNLLLFNMEELGRLFQSNRQIESLKSRIDEAVDRQLSIFHDKRAFACVS